MSIHITHDLPNGQAVMETFAAGELAAITMHEDNDSAFAAVESIGIQSAIEAAKNRRQERIAAELDERYPWRHDHPAKIFMRGLAYSLTHYGRSK